MGEHYPRGQQEAEAWCARCKRKTMHRIDHPLQGQKGGGRLGPCIDPDHPKLGLSKSQERRKKAQEFQQQNPTLF